MSLSDLLSRSPADTGYLARARDVQGLVRLLGSPDPDIRQQACEALTRLGPESVPALTAALDSSASPVRLGVIETLGGIPGPGSAGALVRHLAAEKHIELRYATLLALGEIGDAGAVPHLLVFLQHPDKYLRYGAALALGKTGWTPPDEGLRIAYCIALQDWDAVRAAGPAAVPHLRAVIGDPDPATRSCIARLLGEIGAADGCPACEAGLRDRDPRVRWTAVLAAMNCGIRPARLPPFVAARERTGPDPLAAAILNFLFLGIGYNYIGKWWGFPVFMTYMSVLVLAQLATGPLIPYLVAYPVTAVLGVHTYYLARRMSDL
jgi:HEAT repeat protein